MSTITASDNLVAKRVAMLSDISASLGLRRMPDFTEEQQLLFSLVSTNPLELVDNLNYMRDLLTWGEDLEAAYYVLGIDVDDADDSRRRGALFTRRGERGDVLDLMRLRPKETQGFIAIATSYDTMMKLRKYIESVRASGNNKALETLDAAFDMKAVEA